MREWRIAVTGGESDAETIGRVLTHFTRMRVMILWVTGDPCGRGLPELREAGFNVAQYGIPADTRIGREIAHAEMVNDGFDLLVVFKGGDEDLIERARAAGRQILFAEEP